MKKRFLTGAAVSAWTYEKETYEGVSVGIENRSTGGYDVFVNIECVKCAEGAVNRIVIKKSVLEKLKNADWVVIEE